MRRGGSHAVFCSVFGRLGGLINILLLSLYFLVSSYLRCAFSFLIDSGGSPIINNNKYNYLQPTSIPNRVVNQPIVGTTTTKQQTKNTTPDDRTATTTKTTTTTPRIKLVTAPVIKNNNFKTISERGLKYCPFFFLLLCFFFFPFSRVQWILSPRNCFSIRWWGHR